MEPRAVSRTSIVSHRKRHSSDNAPAALFSRLLDLKKSEALEMATTDEKQSTSIKYALRKIATQEGLLLGWDRNQDHTILYLWIDIPEKKS